MTVWLRALSGFIGVGFFCVAFVTWAIAGVMSPDSHDGCSPPVGDIQMYLGGTASLVCLGAGVVGIGYAFSGKEGRPALLLGLGGLALVGAWAGYLAVAPC